MHHTTAQKLKIKQGCRLLTIHAPLEFESKLGLLPLGVKISDSLTEFDQVHLFVKNCAELKNDMKKVITLVRNEVICWIYFPKATSKIQTDLTRDKGWEEFSNLNMKWLSLISFDETWSSFCIRAKTESDKKKITSNANIQISNYVDTKTRMAQLPDDMAMELKKHAKLELFFNSMSFTHKKEYIEWIVTAKKMETRLARLQKFIELLKNYLKNKSRQ